MQTLPIDPYLDQISVLSEKKPLVLMASPGSGKTTRLPPYLLKKNKLSHGQKIIVIVPKRVSAISAADRIASENNWALGDQVGYQVRFDHKITAQTQLIFMTEGLFLKRIQSLNFWSEINTLIIDEFHERSSQIDIILGLAYEQKILNDQFRLIIMSATLNAAELKKYLGSCETLELKLPPFKLTTALQDKTQKLVCDDHFYQNLKETLIKAWKVSKKDVLVFLPGKFEIMKFKSIIQPIMSNIQIEMLHGSLNLAEQKRIVQSSQFNQSLERRIILSTNVAESSITLSGLDCVIDSGLEKKSYIEPKIGFEGLDLQRISLFSSQQRAGRAAREADGFVFKMWHASDELSMKEQIEPQIIKSDLKDEILILAQQGVTDFKKFSWLTPPNFSQLEKTLIQLKKWKLINSNFQLTELGEILLKWPLSLENSILYYHLAHLGFEKQASKLISLIESDQIDYILEKNKSANLTDLEILMETRSDDQKTDKIRTQIHQHCHLKGLPTLNAESIDDLNLALIEVYAEFFPEKIGFVKNATTAVSMFGRGLQCKPQSLVKNSDYVVVVTGRENHSQYTQAQFVLCFDKTVANKIFAKHAKKHTEIFYDFEKNQFYKNEQLKFENLVLNDFGKTRLSEADLKIHWKAYFKSEQTAFLNLNADYEKIKNKLAFILKKNNVYFELTNECFTILNNFENLLTDIILDSFESLEDFKISQLVYFAEQIFTEHLKNYFRELPDQITTPNGRHFAINYTDEKAPLISLKLQHAFGWNDTPKIMYGKIPLTLELLAPNMRPTQITNQLGFFWKNSYVDVRKELRARYPKHDWPEDPSA